MLKKFDFKNYTINILYIVKKSKTMKNIKTKLTILGFLILGLTGSVHANGNSSANFQASANLTGSCIITAQNFSFGFIDVKQESTRSGQVRFTCSRGLPFTINYSSGNGTLDDRNMVGTVDPLNTLKYNIFLNNGPDIVGDGTNGTRSLSSVGQGEQQITFLTAKIPANQYVKPGNYTDSITVTFTY